MTYDRARPSPCGEGMGSKPDQQTPAVAIVVARHVVFQPLGAARLTRPPSAHAASTPLRRVGAQRGATKVGERRHDRPRTAVTWESRPRFYRGRLLTCFVFNQLEGLAFARTWGFESPLSHQTSLACGELRLGRPTRACNQRADPAIQTFAAVREGRRAVLSTGLSTAARSAQADHPFPRATAGKPRIEWRGPRLRHLSHGGASCVSSRLTRGESTASRWGASDTVARRKLLVVVHTPGGSRCAIPGPFLSCSPSPPSRATPREHAQCRRRPRRCRSFRRHRNLQLSAGRHLEVSN